MTQEQPLYICMLHHIFKIIFPSHLQLFHQSRARLHCHRHGIFPAELMELLQNQQTTNKYQVPLKKKKRVTKGILPNVYCPYEKPISPDSAQQLAVNLKSIGSDAQVNVLFQSLKKGTRTQKIIAFLFSIHWFKNYSL